MYDCINVDGHVEVYYNGVFAFSADNRAEAEREVNERSVEDD